MASMRDFLDNMAAPVRSRGAVRLALHTHFNIALIYDEDRARGMRRAKAFYSWLASSHPRFERMVRSRYRKTLALHYLGVDGPRLAKMMGR